MGIGILVIAVGTALQLAGLAGVHRGRATGGWYALLALSGAGIAAGGLLVQASPGAASLAVAPIVGAVFAVVHARALFAGEGPFRT